MRCWNQMTDRDAAAARRVARLLRFFGDRAFFQNYGWEPHARTLQPGALYATRFPRDEGTPCARGGETLWAIVERAGANASGDVLRLDAMTYAGCSFYDVYRGRAVRPTLTNGTLT
jgi:hypothetical protein